MPASRLRRRRCGAAGPERRSICASFRARLRKFRRPHGCCSERHSIRSFDDERPITLAELARFLDSTARVVSTWQSQVDLGDTRPTVAYATRPYPSAGAGYELELYLAVEKCDGLARGFYHYDAGGHALVPIGVRTQELDALLTEARLSMDAPAAPQIVITIAARFGRVSWKYSSLAYALILKDVGVLIQTLYLMATDMGLGGCAIGSTNIDLFAKMTGIEFHVEGPVGQFALGRGAPTGRLPADRGVHSVSTRTISGLARRKRSGRCGALEISDRAASPRSLQREYGALRVRASDDPAAARHFDRTFQDLAAAGLDALRRRVDVADVEIVEPEREPGSSGLGEHAADHLPSGGEGLIRARLADLGVLFLPAEKVAVESPCLLPVGGEQFVPADAARCVRAAGGCWPGLRHLNSASLAVCGSVKTEKRLMSETSVGGTCTAPPRRVIRSAVASTSSTPTYPTQIGSAPICLASSGSGVSALIAAFPSPNRI